MTFLPAREDIADLALKIYDKHEPAHEVIWQLAEMTLVLEKTFGQKISRQMEDISGFEQDLVRTSGGIRIVRPSLQEVEKEAYYISTRNYRLAELHWYLAEKMLIYRNLIRLKQAR